MIRLVWWSDQWDDQTGGCDIVSTDRHNSTWGATFAVGGADVSWAHSFYQCNHHHHQCNRNMLLFEFLLFVNCIFACIQFVFVFAVPDISTCSTAAAPSRPTPPASQNHQFPPKIFATTRTQLPTARQPNFLVQYRNVIQPKIHL